PKARELRSSMYLQKWRPKKRSLPAYIGDMIKVADKYGLRQEGLAFSRNTLRSMPMWGHAHVPDKNMRAKARACAATACLMNKHHLRTVGEFERFTDGNSWPGHVQRRTCACAKCEELITEARCADPERCRSKAASIFDLLPSKWDPRGVHPEDYEEWVAMETDEPPDEAVLFDRKVVTDEYIADTFRIFTEGEVSEMRANTRLWETAEALEVGTDGSCEKNGDADAMAGAGVYVGDGNPRNIAAKLPRAWKQSNQTGEIVAIAAA
ncbi:hypothetical protein FKP32DRAFT_1557310, partial [Trametes sanguinea]